MALNPQGDVPLSDQGLELVLVPVSARDWCEPGKGSSAVVLHGWTHRDLTALSTAMQLKEHLPSWAIPSSSQLTIWGMHQHVPFLVFRVQKEQTQHSLPRYHFS